jgi:hypothetical protein
MWFRNESSSLTEVSLYIYITIYPWWRQLVRSPRTGNRNLEKFYELQIMYKSYCSIVSFFVESLRFINQRMHVQFHIKHFLKHLKKKFKFFYVKLYVHLFGWWFEVILQIMYDHFSVVLLWRYVMTDWATHFDCHEGSITLFLNVVIHLQSHVIS